MLTINLDAVREVGMIADVVTKARRDLRNLIDTQRRGSGSWGPVEVLLWLETDAIDLADYPRLGPDKREQVGEFVQVFEGQMGVVWLPSLHGVVRLGPSLDVGAARTAFVKQWPGHQCVDLRSFYVTRSMSTNLARIINYSLKHECTTEYYDSTTGEITPREWETKWLGSYYEWLYKWSRGFQSHRIFVRSEKDRHSVSQDLLVFNGGEVDPLI